MKCWLVLVCLLLLASPVSAQDVRPVPDVLSYGTAALNPALATWKAWHSADPVCGLSKLAISELVGNGAVLVLKRVIHSPRPCPGCVADGMPSGHSMNGAIGAFSNGGWGFAFTVPTPFLRVEANRHTRKQAVVGTLIGLGADAFGQYVMKCGS